MEKLIDGQKRMEMSKKIISENKDCQIKNNSYDVLNKKKVSLPKKMKSNMNLLELSQNVLVSKSRQPEILKKKS